METNLTPAQRAIETKRKKYGEDYFAKNGKKGGEARNLSEKRYTPFADREFAKRMSKLGTKKRWDNHKNPVDN